MQEKRFGKDFIIKQVYFYSHTSNQTKSIVLPVDWRIRIVRGQVTATGSKVRISFLQAGKTGFLGQLTEKSTVSAVVTLSDGGDQGRRIAFELKSPLFSRGENHVQLISEQRACVF